MVERVLVAMDDSELAERALRYALDVHRDADVTVLHVVGEPSGMMGAATGIALADDSEERVRELSEDVFERAGKIATEYGVEVKVESEVGSPASRIVERADDFDAVVIGTHSGSLADRLLVGNVAKSVFQNSPVPVTVVR
ncbi:universal stress protein [Halorubrum sp. Ib24]|uniref:universal stress protein n=1 Tax=unclassified Halorubrum TaxID=2642239 RepID=UPI000B97CB9A|nr:MULTISPECIES: universal stress protein [unclassified Halorubrum]OYR38388.1 universal stress protein [Halorubrum sp. Ib24]OYR40680.1 universal stress protein [Halorubrum sp. Hd13]OYR47513.1 universal stress protein [Halorubrum sp. Ea8]OYR48117.1 universal stress protein [Halorubrum sp. Eb13]OYR52624.1 universal stress protein [Halorubrum sp. Ea1]